MSKGPEL
jgi:hypothetical protein